MPTVADIVALSRKNLYVDSLSELDSVLQRTMKRLVEPPDRPFDLYVFFGQASDSRFRRLASEAEFWDLDLAVTAVDALPNHVTIVGVVTSRLDDKPFLSAWARVVSIHSPVAPLCQ